ncbi:MAG: CoA-binding protein [Alphaproteobacteria bacterium]|jgi:predicted CoA-binding protein|nr:CoA-binding protein [Alphaproteobacteria bacterium]
MSIPLPLRYSDATLRGILSEIRVMAMVGASGDWKRPSFFAMKYLQRRGYRVIPINPGRAGTEILGETVYASLADVPVPIDMVDVFRSSEAALGVAEEAVALVEEKQIKVLWLQLGIRNDAAAEIAQAAGIQVIMDRCPKIEFARLSGELSWSGINTRIITSKVLKAPRA